MARRNLLHRNRLEEFKKWLGDNYGWVILKTKGPYEVLRWDQDNHDNESGYGAMPIIYNGKSPNHLSCNEASLKTVKKFIRDTK